jgi:hypothetical protein
LLPRRFLLAFLLHPGSAPTHEDERGSDEDYGDDSERHAIVD